MAERATADPAAAGGDTSTVTTNPNPADPPAPAGRTNPVNGGRTAASSDAPHDAGAPAAGPQPKPRRAPEARPEQILDAATDIMLSKGLQGMTMDEIAGVAGLAKGTTYLYFKSKAQVLAALRIRHVQRMLKACDEAAAAGQPVATIVRVERFVETVWEFTLANAPLLQLLFHEAGGDDGTELGMARDGLMIYVREGIASGEFEVEDPDTVVSFLVHGMHGAFAGGLHGDPADRARMLESVKGVFRRQLLGERPD